MKGIDSIKSTYRNTKSKHAGTEGVEGFVLLKVDHARDNGEQ